VLGAVWVAEELYPDFDQFDLPKEIKAFYQAFYHWQLND